MSAPVREEGFKVVNGADRIRLDGCHAGERILWSTTFVQDRIPVFCLVVGRVGLEPTAKGL
jgi:hypothetical protein